MSFNVLNTLHPSLSYSGKKKKKKRQTHSGKNNHISVAQNWVFHSVAGFVCLHVRNTILYQYCNLIDSFCYSSTIGQSRKMFSAAGN